MRHLTLGLSLALFLLGCAAEEGPDGVGQGGSAPVADLATQVAEQGLDPLALQGIGAGPVAMRRLTQSQYRQSVRDVLGQDLEIAGQLEPDIRREGLLAVGSSHVTVTATGFEQYESMAYRIAEQALDEDRRGANVPCEPVSDERADDACAEAFVEGVGRRLFRRALTDEEISARVAIAAQAADTLSDFYGGLEFALASLLTSPSFLFRVATLEEDALGAQRLSADTMASRLSYALWDSAPDAALLDAAESGELLEPEGLAAQITRMLSSERLDEGVRALFTDVLAFERFDDGFRKDGALFPAYKGSLIDEAREETLKTITDHLTSGRDYRDLFTSPRTFLSRQLATLYGVPAEVDEGFVPYDFDDESPRGGLLTHASLLALYAHPGRSSPTLRGEFVRAAFLCQHVPPPPGDVDFSLVEQPSEELPTIRDKVEVHMSEPACAGCHAMTDPIGLALEQFDGIGRFRTTENGALIDTSGELDGDPFDDARGLGRALSAHPELAACLVSHVYKSVVGRRPVADEAEEVERIEALFADSGYSVPALFSAILGSPSVRWTSGPEEVSP